MGGNGELGTQSNFMLTHRWQQMENSFIIGDISSQRLLTLDLKGKILNWHKAPLQAK